MAARNKYAEFKKAMKASPAMHLQRKGDTAYITNGAIMLRVPYSIYESQFADGGKFFPEIPNGASFSRRRKGDPLLGSGMDCERAWESFPETHADDLDPIELTGISCRAMYNEVDVTLCRGKVLTFASYYVGIAYDLNMELLTHAERKNAPAYGSSPYGEILLLPVRNKSVQEHLLRIAEQIAK